MKRPQWLMRGFTLIELLVVTGVLGVLFALLASAISGGKVAVHRVGCLNHLKQWGVAAHVYAADNDDRLPRESAVDGVNTWEMTGAVTNRDVWYNALADSMRITSMEYYARTPSSQPEFYSRGKLFHCPQARFSAISATYPNFSIAMNSKLMPDFEGWPGSSTPGGGPPVSLKQLKMSQVKEPDRTVLFLDAGVPGEDRLSPFQAPFTGQPKAYASQFPGRHKGRGNIGFVAGNAATFAGSDVVEMNPASAYRGGAIYPPDKIAWRHDPVMVP